MCEEAGPGSCEHISDTNDFEAFASMASAKGKNIEGTGKGDTFAFPILDDDGFIISQSAAATMYAAERFGFLPEGSKARYKAFQYMNDAQDFMTEGLSTAGHPDSVAEFMFTGPRFDAWMGNIERSIQGPYYFGRTLTCVDFYLLQCMDWLNTTLLQPISELTGDRVAPYPKVTTLLHLVRSRPAFWREQSWRPTVELPPLEDQSAWVQQLQALVGPPERQGGASRR